MKTQLKKVSGRERCLAWSERQKGSRLPVAFHPFGRLPIDGDPEILVDLAQTALERRDRELTTCLDLEPFLKQSQQLPHAPDSSLVLELEGWISGTRIREIG